MGSQQEHKGKLLVQILSMCFGFGSWIAMTGLWVELPLLTQKLPESWTLGSYLTVMIQLANIGPIIYWWARTKQICSEMTAIHIQMLIGTVACILLIFWWDTTITIFGAQRSIVLYVASFGLSIVDCTSSVVFLPYMARFKAYHMTPYLIGEGLSGFLPSLVALAQGVSEDGDKDCPIHSNANMTETSIDGSGGPNTIRFSANVFFCFLLLILLISWVACTCLNCLAVCQVERIGQDERKPEMDTDITDGDFENSANARVQILELQESNTIDKSLQIRFRRCCEDNQKYIWLLGLMTWGCFTTFGAMPSIQSYSCLPYGSETFFYAVTLSGLAYPAACIAGLFLDFRSPSLFNGLTIVGSGIGVYIIVCGAMSPNPPFKMEISGSVIMIVSWFVYVGMISYMKTMVSLELNDFGGNQAMFWCGFAQQFGAASGGALIFCIVNFTNVFKEEDKCS